MMTWVTPSDIKSWRKQGFPTNDRVLVAEAIAKFFGRLRFWRQPRVCPVCSDLAKQMESELLIAEYAEQQPHLVWLAPCSDGCVAELSARLLKWEDR